MAALVIALIVGPRAARAVDIPPPPDDKHSYSLKNASDGYLVRGVRLKPRGLHHVVLKPTVRRGYHWGTRELVGALKRAARQVAAKYPGSKLQVANMSKEGGGDITPSVSHNSGRDADVSFYIMDRRGRPVMRDGFTRFDARGHSGDVRFDAARNWAFVKALLTDPSIQVQWMFCSHSLRGLLLEHARKAGEAASLVDRAGQVLGQPGNSSPHAEHFHVRLYCARHERLAGCLNYGTMHPWIDTYQKEVDARALTLAADLRSPNLEVAIVAARSITAIRGQAALMALAEALADPRRALRFAAADAIERLSPNEGAVDALITALEQATDPEWTWRVADVLASIGDRRAAKPFSRLLAKRSVADRTRALAARGLGEMLDLASVPTLVGALTDRDRTVRSSAAEALLRITNHSFGTGRRAAKRWKKWWRANKDRTRLEWVEAGFAALGIKGAHKPSLRMFKKLLRHIRKGGARGFNARAWIASLTGYAIEQGHFSDFQMFRFYRSWLKRGGWRKRPVK